MNSKKLALIAIFSLLALGLGAFSIYTKKMNSIGFRGIGFSVKGVGSEAIQDWMGTFESVLKREEVLQKIIEQSGYLEKFSVSEGEAIPRLRSAVNVNFSEGRKNIQLGLRGKRKNNASLDEVSRVIFNVAAPYVAEEKPAFKKHYLSLSQSGQ